MSKFKLSLVLRLLSGIVLILAIGGHPSSFYSVLRIIVFISSLLSGWIFSKAEKSNLAWTFFIIAIIFNPLLPVYLNRSIWQLIDVFAALVFFASLKIDVKKA